MVVQDPSFHHLLSSPTFYTMAMLTAIHTEILCLLCDRQVHYDLEVLYSMHPCFLTLSFLCIGAGADKVKAAVCTICNPCLAKMTSTNDKETDNEKLRRKAELRLSRGELQRVIRKKGVFIIATLGKVQKYMLDKKKHRLATVRARQDMQCEK
jgi:hypothetical protein